MTPNIRPVVIGSFSPPVLTCIRSWKRLRYPAGIICIESGNRTLLEKVKFLRSFIKLDPDELYTPGGISRISGFLREFDATSLVCISEKIACWLNDYRVTLPQDVVLCFPSNAVIENLLSKQNQIEAARGLGIGVLPTYYVNGSGQACSSIPFEYFPLCLRPSDPSKVIPSFKVHLVYDKSELKDFIRSRKAIERPIVAQPFRNLPNLVVHGTRTNTGRTIRLQAFLVERKFEGVTLTLRPTALSPDLGNKCVAFTDHFRLTGPYHFEFLLDEDADRTYFLELNNRLGGTTAKVYACGYDEPAAALEAYGFDTAGCMKLRDVTVSNRQALMKYLLFTLRGKLTPLDYPTERKTLRIARAIRGLFEFKDEIFSLDDLNGSIALHLANLKEFARLS